jgi:hypothetical protein
VPAVGVDLKRANANLKLISSNTPIGHNFPVIADNTREKAQDQYRRVLEKTLGSPDDVLPTYRAWLHVIESESGSEELNADDATLADR